MIREKFAKGVNNLLYSKEIPIFVSSTTDPFQSGKQAKQVLGDLQNTTVVLWDSSVPRALDLCHEGAGSIDCNTRRQFRKTFEAQRQINRIQTGTLSQ